MSDRKDQLDTFLEGKGGLGTCPGCGGDTDMVGDGVIMHGAFAEEGDEDVRIGYREVDVVWTCFDCGSHWLVTYGACKIRQVDDDPFDED
jgi:hypothetical protein